MRLDCGPAASPTSSSVSQSTVLAHNGAEPSTPSSLAEIHAATNRDPPLEAERFPVVCCRPTRPRNVFRPFSSGPSKEMDSGPELHDFYSSTHSAVAAKPTTCTSQSPGAPTAGAHKGRPWPEMSNVPTRSVAEFETRGTWIKQTGL